MGKFAFFVLFGGHLDEEGAVICAWTLYDDREDVRRAFGNNRYVDPKVPLVPEVTRKGQILCLKGTNVWCFLDNSAY